MEKKDKKEKPEMLFIPGGVILGVGYGLLIGNIAAYTMIGLGLGFVLSAVTGLLRKNKWYNNRLEKEVIFLENYILYPSLYINA